MQKGKTKTFLLLPKLKVKDTEFQLSVYMQADIKISKPVSIFSTLTHTGCKRLSLNRSKITFEAVKG